MFELSHIRERYQNGNIQRVAFSKLRSFSLNPSCEQAEPLSGIHGGREWVLSLYWTSRYLLSTYRCRRRPGLLSSPFDRCSVHRLGPSGHVEVEASSLQSKDLWGYSKARTQMSAVSGRGCGRCFGGCITPLCLRCPVTYSSAGSNRRSAFLFFTSCQRRESSVP
jgi:hypothetical protein